MECTRQGIAIDSHAQPFKVITIVLVIVGIISGIVCGSVFSIVDLTEIGLYSSPIETTTKFNYGIMFTVWVGTVIAAVISWAVYSILDSMDNILIELIRANRYHKQNAEKE